jgi:hypothetical protein
MKAHEVKSQESRGMVPGSATYTPDTTLTTYTKRIIISANDFGFRVRVRFHLKNMHTVYVATETVLDEYNKTLIIIRTFQLVAMVYYGMVL